MRIMRILKSSVIIVGMLFLLVACKPHEERVMDRLDRLSEKIQKNGEKWDADQWADALEELEDIHYDMEDCEFTPAQLRALGRVEGRLTVIIMTEGAKKLGDGVVTFMEGAGAFMKGYREGTESMKDYSEEELKNYGTQLDKELESIQKELNEESASKE